VRQFTRRPRPSDPRFDKECRDVKRLTRRLERAYRAAIRRADRLAGSSSSTVAVAKSAASKAAWYNQRRQYQKLRRSKCTEFWCDKIDAEQSDSRRLWNSLDTLLGRGRVPASSDIDVEAFNRFFVEKVARVRAGTSDAPPPLFSHVRPDTSFPVFSLVTIDDVIAAAR